MSQPLCFATQRVRWINYQSPCKQTRLHFDSSLQHSCHAFNPMGKYVIASQTSQGCSEFSQEQRCIQEPNTCKGSEKHVNCGEKALSSSDLALS